MAGITKERAVERIAELAERGLDLVTFWQESTEVIAAAVPHYMSPCWFTIDPASLLVTSHYQTEILELPAEWLAHEYYEDDFHKMADVAVSERGVSTIHEATDGDPSRSTSWNLYVKPYGGDQELLVALRTKSGDPWGVVGIYREPGQPQFDRDDMDFLRTISQGLAEGAQRGLLLGEALDPEGPESPGLVVLRDDWTIESFTPGAERWLDELPDGDRDSGKLPTAILSVAGRALRTAVHEDAPGEVALARVLSREGRWIVLHGAALLSGEGRRVAVIIEPAHPARISSLLMAAYNLTDREQDVTTLVLRGNSTSQIAERLFVSPSTVQQHLKSVFEKTGVHSRRDLVGKVFFTHYEPRFRDNERRALDGDPMRGGPFPEQTPL